jgi:hypothetical protein
MGFSSIELVWGFNVKTPHLRPRCALNKPLNNLKSGDKKLWGGKKVQDVDA